jgi:hypothetical protein
VAMANNNVIIKIINNEANNVEIIINNNGNNNEMAIKSINNQ